MTLTEDQQRKWHEEHPGGPPVLTAEEHEAFLKQMGISKTEDAQWHREHHVPRPEKPRVQAGRKPVNCFAIGGGFLSYCVRQGWLVQEGKGRSARYFATKEGAKALAAFGINI